MKFEVKILRSLAACLLLVLIGSGVAALAWVPSPAAAADKQNCKTERKCTQRKICKVEWVRYKTNVCRTYTKKVNGKTITQTVCGPGYKKRQVNRCTNFYRCKRVKVCA